MITDIKVQQLTKTGIVLAGLGTAYTAWTDSLPLSDLAAVFYAGLIIMVVLFHIALALGAPWGVYTLGGRWDGQLPVKARIIPVLSVPLLGFMAVVILIRRGIVPLDWPPALYWVAMALTFLTFLANTATPSLPERAAWAPVTALMLLSGLIAGLS